MSSAASYGCPSTSLADFKQLAKLGEGAYSAVYKVLRIADHRTYALKNVKLPSLSEKEKQNALNEVRLLASVQNDNIIAYKEAFFDDKSRCLCIVQECADAGDLLQQINKFKQQRAYLPETDVWRYLDGMCRGLKALHDLKILHRDMKCANVFLSASQNGIIAKLGDFNVSKVAKRGLCMTQTGTPYYASPEVWRDMPYDGKSDMWSMGCVLYEMVALRPPFRAEDMEGLYKKVVRGQYPRIPQHYSTDLGDVIAGLLQVHPRHRPTVDQLLSMPAVLRNTVCNSRKEVEGVPSDLLQTIKLPKNMIDLPGCLPKARYAASDASDAVSHVAPAREPIVRDRIANSPSSPSISGGHHASAASQPRTQPGDAGAPRANSLPRAPQRIEPAPSRRRLPAGAADSGRYQQDGSDSDMPQLQKQCVSPSYSGAATPVRGQNAHGVQDSLDAYLQQRQDPVDAHEPKNDGYAYMGPATPAAASGPGHGGSDGGSAVRGSHGSGSGAPGSSINPRYNANAGGGTQGGGRPPREPRRPMSIYARQQYAVAEQGQQPAQQEQQPLQQQKADSQKETPGGSRRLRSLIPRLF